MNLRQLRKMRACIYYTTVLVVVNVLLMTSLSVWLTPSQEQWFPKHLANRPRKEESFVLRFFSTRTNLNRTLQILLWTPWFGDSDWAVPDFSSVFSSCSVSDCLLTKHKSDIVTADAVLFHALDLWNTMFGYPLPEYRSRDQVWVLLNQEPPPHTPLNYQIFNNVFNWTATYRTDSDVQMPYHEMKKLTQPNPSPGDVAATKSAGIIWVASNCGDDARRQMLVREINKYFPVDTYGDCGDKTITNENFSATVRKYKFYLSFENSYCRDYITEKLSNPLRFNVIPVVAGGGDYKTIAPPHSYIDVADFNSVEDLAIYLRYLDKNNTAYNSYFQWTEKYASPTQLTRSWCDLCEALHDGRRPPQVYTDLHGYISDDTCQQWTLSGYVSRNMQGYAMKFGLV